MNHHLLCKNCNVRTISIFSFLKDNDLGKLNENKSRTLYKKGQNIFYDGRKPTGIFCLNIGKVKIYKIGYDGKEQIVRFVMPGGLLGIRALLGGRNYSASAMAIEDSQVCYIEKKAFFRLALQNPQVSHQLMITLSTLLEDAEKKLTSLAQKPVRERLAETLLILHKLFSTENKINPKLEPVISLTREDLANIVGTAKETVIRLISDFKENGLIKVNGRKIKLVDIDGLIEVGKVYE